MADAQLLSRAVKLRSQLPVTDHGQAQGRHVGQAPGHRLE